MWKTVHKHSVMLVLQLTVVQVQEEIMITVCHARWAHTRILAFRPSVRTAPLTTQHRELVHHHLMNAFVSIWIQRDQVPLENL